MGRNTHCGLQIEFLSFSIRSKISVPKGSEGEVSRRESEYLERWVGEAYAILGTLAEINNPQSSSPAKRQGYDSANE